MLIIKWKYGTDTVTYKSYSGTVKDWVDENIIKPKKEAFIKSGAECVCEVQATPDSLRDYVVFVGLSIALCMIFCCRCPLAYVVHHGCREH